MLLFIFPSLYLFILPFVSFFFSWYFYRSFFYYYVNVWLRDSNMKYNTSNTINVRFQNNQLLLC